MGSVTYIYESAADEAPNPDDEMYSMVATGGQFSLLNSFQSVDDNGFFADLSAEFQIYGDETAIASALESLTAEQMTILNEITAYTYTGFDEGNEQITLFASGYNGLTDPQTLTPSSETFFGLIDYYKYSIVINTDEINGLKSRFGIPTVQQGIASQIQSKIETAALEVINSYQSKRMIFKRVHRQKINPNDFGVTLSITGSGGSTTISTAAAPSLFGGGGGY